MKNKLIHTFACIIVFIAARRRFNLFAKSTRGTIILFANEQSHKQSNEYYLLQKHRAERMIMAIKRETMRDLKTY